MDPKLQGIADNIQRATGLSDAEKDLLLQSIKEVDKAGSLSKFKLERLEHDKQTLSVMLEESIEDLQKKSRAIEAQNRELEIEAALERVRAVALSMMKPEGMLEVCKVISSQLEFLKVKDVRNVQTAIFYESKGIYVNYEFYAKHNKELITEVEYANHPVSQNFAEQMLKGPNQVWTYSFKGQEVKDWLNYQKGTNVFIDTYLENADTLNYYWYSLGPVGIGMSAYSPLQEQEIELFKRFRNVFELAYRRYLDIEKAEAQAREAIIEAALEKIRSTSLAMHRSDEIVNVVAVLFEKLKELGLIFDGGVAIVLSKEGSRDAVIGVVSPEKVVPSFHDLPYDEEAFADNPIALDEWKAKEEGVDVINKHYSFEEKNRYFEYVFKHNDESKIPRPLREFILKAGSYTATNIAEKNSLLIANSWTEQLFSEENIAVLRRVARVFEQAYVRFLDLQKAEAQAREAKIEAALEKVRSQANAMHRSEGLREVIKEVHNQLRHLKFRFDSADFLTDYTDQGYNIWLATTDPSIPSPIFVPYFDHRIFHLLKEEVGQGHDFFTFQLTQKEKDRYFKHVFETALAKYEHQESREFVLNAKGMATSCVVLRNIILSITNFASIPYTEEENNIIKRFAYVFEQSYIRFLDLKKAEAQARESQIEAALEKVRSSSLAMHHSDELEHVVVTLFDRLVELRLSFDAALIFVFEKQKRNIELWVASRVTAPIKVSLPYDNEIAKNSVIEDLWSAVEKGEDIINRSYSGKVKNDYYHYIGKHNESRIPEEIRTMMIEAESWTVSFAAEKNSVLGIDSWAGVLTVDKDFEIVKRFARVFEQAYVRFLDLQKAEAQARESQIELGLERVRARAMAMQRSDELKELIATVSEELGKLDFVLDRSFIHIIDQQTMGQTWWMSHPEAPDPVGLFLKYHEHKPYLALLDAWRERKLKFQYVLEGDTKKEWDKFLFAETELSQLPEIVIANMRSKEKVYLSSSFNNFGYLSVATLEPLSNDQFDVLLRFAKVFDLTYTRFNDLKQAEAQARESQIQLALERVRARTMAMQRSEELRDAAALLFQQAQALGARSFACGFSIWGEEKKTATFWMAQESMIQPPFTANSTEDVFHEIYEAAQRRESLYVKAQEGKELEAHYRYMSTIPIFKGIMEKMEQAGRSVPTFQILHCAFFSQGFLLFITYEPVQEIWEVFKRFAKVFEQTYTRFLDLQKAESQARESQIEAGLERVRSRSMAMHKSEELSEVVAVVFQEKRKLGFNLTLCNIVLFDEKSLEADYWLSDNDQTIPPQAYRVPYFDHPLYQYQVNTWKNKLPYATFELAGKDKASWEETLKTKTDIGNLPESIWQIMMNIDRLFLSSVATKHGLLQVIASEQLSDELASILKRFAKVFEQTYTRFLDLQKAEAQSRESQIQLALERVRARTMAMQRSDELSEAVYVLFQQFRELGENPDQATIGVVNEDEHVIEYWVTMYGNQMDRVFKFSIDEPHVTNRIYKAWKRGDKSLVIDLSGKELYEFTTYRESMGGAKRNPHETRRVINVAFFSKGLLNVQSNQNRSDESIRLLERFALVFDQTYTRFIDLQRAEAQAKESQIQLALERVRARTMAMHQSDELTDVAALLFNQVSELGIKTWTTGFNVWSDDNNSYVDYIRSPQGGFIEPYTVLTETAEALRDISNARKSGVEFDVQYVEGEKIKQLYRALTKLGEKQFEIMLQDGVRFPSHQYEHFVFGSKVSLMFITYEPVPEAHDVFKRLGKVFEQTYTRFLDLQKAEAQARESQIQLALERVRARTMAMQKSDELADVAELLFKQVNDLGIKTWTTGFNVWSDDNNFYTDFVTNPQGGFMEPYTIDVTKTPVLIEISSAKKRGDEFLVTYEEGEALAETYRQLSKFGEKQFKSILEMGFEFPSHQYEHFVFGAKVSLMFITYDPMPEAHDIFKRFGKVFEQTYTRFLDLQKAEAQARESQIQLALERVRARTMAMHRSEELMDAANLLFQQVQSLGIPVWSCGYNIWEKGEKACTGWMSTNGAIQPSFRIPLTEHRTFIHMNESRLKDEAFYVEEMRGEELAEHYKYMFSLPDFKEMATKQVEEGFALPKSQINNVFNFKHGNLIFLSAQAIPDALDIFKRFTAVFEQTYTRFLDLQKAEAQTREAQIEAALEKVRSRSLAMHKSDELQEVVHTVFERLRELNVQVYTAIIIIFKEGSKDIVWWMQNKINQQYSRILIKYSGIPYLEDLFDAKEKSKELFSKCYVGEEKLKLYEYLFHHTDLKSVPEDQKKFLLENEFAAISIAFAKNTAIHLTSYSERSFSEEDHDILKRFAKVFDQAYTRFLDLQKAEAQAKEAQIEAGLERVRSKAMAMHKADDLNPAVAIVFEELDKLDLGMLRCGIGIIDKEKRHVGVWTTSASDEKNTVQVSGAESMDIHPLLRGAFDAWVKRTDFSYTLQGEDLFQYYSAVGETNIRLPQSQTEATTQYYYMASFDTGGLFAFRESEFYEEGKAVMKRFANVFNLTYKRFLDLQKAEAQAREAQIEAALEKIRSRSLAMHKSHELKEVIHSVFERLNDLDFELDTAAIIIFEEASKDTVWWLENIKDKQHSGVAVAYTDIHYFTKLFEAKQSGKEIISNFYNLEKKNEYLKYFFDHTDFRYTPEQQKEFLLSQNCVSMSVAIARNTAIHVVRYSERSFSEAQNEILKKFSKVFDQAYTRFLDLQKAEAQARESQIQLALERARAQSMIMQHSKELDDTLRVFHEQVLQLNIPSAFSFLWLPDEENQRHIFWAAWAENNSFKSKAINYPLDKNEPATAQCLIDWKSNAPVVAYHVPPAGVENYFAAWSELIAGVEQLKPEYFSDGLYYVEGFMKYGCFGVMVKHPLQEHENKILERFAIEFERAYTRFLDLQKAEAQTREAEIELALERVRARTMAMQKHDDLIGVINTLAEQLLQLGFDLQVANFSNGISDRDWDLWLFGMFDNGVSFTKRAVFPWFDHPFFHRVYAALDQYRKGGSDLSVEVFNKEEKDSWLDHTFSKTEFNDTPLELREGAYKAPGYCWSSIILKETWVAIGKYDTTPFTQEQNNILRKFATAFDQAYTRFLDLQKAEAQAREAKIEAALERVRASAMAMHQSEQLKEVANELRKQLGFLGQRELETCAIHLYDDSPDYFQSWAALLSPNEQGEVIQIRSQFPKRGVKIIEEMLECYARHKQDYVLMNEGARAQEFLEMLKQKAPEVFEVVEKSMKEQIPELKRAYWSVADFAGGSLVMTTMIEPDENSRALLRRFANVFGLAYRRFVDLKKAEAQAKEAQIETALERVRSRTLAMQRSDELAETAAVVFQQLIHLGIEPNRLYINIVKDETGEAEFWITDEDGSKIAMAYSTNMNDNPSMKKMYEGWKAQNKSLIIDMHGKELDEYFKFLNSLNVPFKGGLSQKRRLQYIAYFGKGFIGMASPDEQPAETMQLLERFAAVFNLTFTRFNDLKIAEAHALKAEQDLVEIKAARKHAEDALVELQATQKQLVQSEKMASLGELTAGIAHEIQNPLNFVNNFSDVSNELLEEMKAELEKGNTKDAAAIVNDVKQNLQKILYHGRRADAIVKGMLQHSRNSSGQKELTDINALADEYLRLAYHGLRAKDKSFNAKFNTDFDKNVGKVNIIPQEIGRVILNLINNAFYAVNERQKACLPERQAESARFREVKQEVNPIPLTLPHNYEPTVSVSTKKVDDKVIITIADNGNGIPQKNLDKIFQPFFTTKPTGQGTGLGLSLAYDIITKGHNGDIKIETKEGEGSKFIVIIPSTQ